MTGGNLQDLLPAFLRSKDVGIDGCSHLYLEVTRAVNGYNQQGADFQQRQMEEAWQIEGLKKMGSE